MSVLEALAHNDAIKDNHVLVDVTGNMLCSVDNAKVFQRLCREEIFRTHIVFLALGTFYGDAWHVMVDPGNQDEVSFVFSLLLQLPRSQSMATPPPFLFDSGGEDPPVLSHTAVSRHHVEVWGHAVSR